MGEVLLIIVGIIVFVFIASKLFGKETQNERYNKIRAKKLADIGISESKDYSHINTNKRNSIDIELNRYEKELASKKEFSSLTIFSRGATFFKSDTNEPYYFFFDCETTGLPGSGKIVRIVQLAWMILDKNFHEVKSESFYLNPGKPIPEEATAIHHITDEIIREKSKPHIEVLTQFYSDLESCTWIIAHNFSFDSGRIDLETKKAKLIKPLLSLHKQSICTMERGTKYCKITPKVYGEYKWPTLDELASYCGFRASGLHDALSDTCITAKCFEIMVREKYIKKKGINL